MNCDICMRLVTDPGGAAAQQQRDRGQAGHTASSTGGQHPLIGTGILFLQVILMKTFAFPYRHNQCF
jgi:hypothetical protein